MLLIGLVLTLACAHAVALPQAAWLSREAAFGGALHPDRPAGDNIRRGASVAVAGAATQDDSPLPPRLRYEHETIKELVVGAGYPLEEHFVTTADGYVLGVYRIPHGRDAPAGSSGRDGGGAEAASTGRRLSAGGSGSGSSGSISGGPRRPPVLLQHGLLDSSAAWVLNQPSQSLGFILADAGYDVWMGNSRGDLFSRNHTGLDPGQAAFWDFTWDDMADYDMPAVVTYILQHNGASQLAYVGHSQGTTQMFAALASNPDLRRQLSVAAMLAPAVHMRGIQSLPLQLLAAMDADRLFNLFGTYEFLPTRKGAADIFGELCRTSPMICASVVTAIAGYNAANMNITRLATAVQYAPSGTSVKNMAHWAQAIRKSREQHRPLFQKYDYGNICHTPTGLPLTCNMRVYHSLEPPSYDLGSIRSPPLAIFYGGKDRMADPQDVETLLAALPAGAVVYTQLEPSYEHLDFTWGIDARQRIYPAVLQLLQRFSQE